MTFDVAAEPLGERIPVTPPSGIPHMSWSRLRAYLACPRAFEYRYILEVPAERTPASLAVGIAVHKAVELTLERRMEGLESPTPEESKGIVESVFATLDPPIATTSKEEGTDSEVAVRCATKLVEAIPTLITGEILAIEDTLDGRPWADLPPITGRVDLVTRTPEGIRVIDFKTSRARWSPLDVSLQAGQLLLYKSIAQGAYGENKADISLEFITVTKAQKPVVESRLVTGTDTSIDRLHEQFSQVWKGINSGVFPPRPDRQCVTCQFHSRCPHAAM